MKISVNNNLNISNLTIYYSHVMDFKIIYLFGKIVGHV